MIKAIFFDLDGTLLPLNERKFAKIYFKTLYKKVKFLKISKMNFFKALYKGALAQVKNDGTRTNEEVFWESIKNTLGMDLSIYKDVLNEYYNTSYLKTKRATKPCLESKKIVEFCRENGLKTILSTNPIFPRLAVLNRMNFVNLKEEDFDYITNYSNSTCCKPNSLYFEKLLETLNLKAEEVILFGNNEIEDAKCAREIGIKCYLIERCLISQNKKKDITYPIIKIEEVIPTIKKEISRND